MSEAGLVGSVGALWRYPVKSMMGELPLQWQARKWRFSSECPVPRYLRALFSSCQTLSRPSSSA